MVDLVGRPAYGKFDPTLLMMFTLLALGVLSPSIHAARLHFVEWMGKFYDGSGTAFKPLGGKSLHVEG